MAIRLYYRYQELVTHKRIVAVVISIWAISALISFIRFWITVTVSYVIFTVLEVFFLITTAFLYCKIYVAVRRHTNVLVALLWYFYLTISKGAEDIDDPVDWRGVVTVLYRSSLF